MMTVKESTDKIPMISTDEDSGDKIDSLNAEKVAADWEDGPWKSRRSRSRESRTLQDAIIVRAAEEEKDTEEEKGKEVKDEFKNRFLRSTAPSTNNRGP